MDRWMDGQTQPTSTTRKVIQTVLSNSVRSSTEMTLCMTQLLRTFTGDQIVECFSLHWVKNRFTFLLDTNEQELRALTWEPNSLGSWLQHLFTCWVTVAGLANLYERHFPDLL